jgi:hypothetical protein
MGVGSPSFPEELNWVSFIDQLAGGDITKYALVYEIRYEECLMKLLLNHHKDKYTNEINRRQQLQRK